MNRPQQKPENRSLENVYLEMSSKPIEIQVMQLVTASCEGAETKGMESDLHQRMQSAPKMREVVLKKFSTMQDQTERKISFLSKSIETKKEYLKTLGEVPEYQITKTRQALKNHSFAKSLIISPEESLPIGTGRVFLMDNIRAKEEECECLKKKLSILKSFLDMFLEELKEVA